MKLPAFLLLVFCSSGVFAQDTTTFEYRWKEIQKETVDTIKVNKLLDLVAKHIFSDPDSMLISVIEEALDISLKINYSRGQSLSYERLGIIYGYIRHNFPQAVRYYNLSLKAADMKDSSSIFSNYGNIAVIYFETRQFGRCKEILEKARTFLPTSLLGTIQEVVYKINVANVLAETNNLDSAYSIYLVNVDQLKGTPYYFATLSSMSEILNKKGQYEEAKKILDDLIKNQSTQPASAPKFIAWLNMAAVEVKTGNVQSALQYAKATISIADSLGSYQLKAKAALLYSECLEAAQDYKSSLVALHEHLALKDKAVTEDKIQEISFLEAEGEFEREAVITQLRHQAAITSEKNKKNLIIAGSLIAIIAGVAYSYAHQKRVKLEQKIKTSQLTEQLSEAEMKALRSQMNPHFIFNALNSIRHYNTGNAPEKADEYLLKFANLMRQVFENADHKKVSLSDDLKALELYIQIESMRLRNGFSYQINIDKEIDTENTLIPPLLLQPYVENSIWHGLSSTDDATINIAVTRQGDMVSYTIEDNGIGISNVAKTNVAGKTSGTKVTQTRIDLINKMNNSNANVQYLQVAKGTKVEITLPLELNY